MATAPSSRPEGFADDAKREAAHEKFTAVLADWKKEREIKFEELPKPVPWNWSRRSRPRFRHPPPSPPTPRPAEPNGKFVNAASQHASWSAVMRIFIFGPPRTRFVNTALLRNDTLVGVDVADDSMHAEFDVCPLLHVVSIEPCNLQDSNRTA